MWLGEDEHLLVLVSAGKKEMPAYLGESDLGRLASGQQGMF